MTNFRFIQLYYEIILIKIHMINIQKSSLFKFRPIDLNTLESLRDNYLFFNNPIDFNDPFDCRMNINYSGNEKEWTKFLDRMKTPMEEREFTINHLSNFNTFQNEKMNPMINHKVLSLSEKFDEILLWSHYTNNHQGICIEYNTHRIDEMDDLQFMIFDKEYVNYPLNDSGINNILPIKKVSYLKSLPSEFNPLRDSSDELDKFILTKYEKWCYEKEWRILTHNENLIKSKKVRLTSDGIKRVIFGLKTSLKDIRNVDTFLRHNPNYNNIKISKINVNENKYSLGVITYDSISELIMDLPFVG